MPHRSLSVVSCRALGAGAALLILTAACGRDPTAPAAPTCGPDTRVAISGGVSAPTVSWAPACAVSFVVIVDAATDAPLWGIRTSTPTLASPQRAFETPSGAYALGRSARLTAGTTYEVLLAVRDTNDTGAIGERLVASTTYTP